MMSPYIPERGKDTKAYTLCIGLDEVLIHYTEVIFLIIVCVYHLFLFYILYFISILMHIISNPYFLNLTT